MIFDREGEGNEVIFGTNIGVRKVDKTITWHRARGGKKWNATSLGKRRGGNNNMEICYRGTGDNLRLVPISFLRVARLMNIYGVTNFNLDRNENRGSCVILPTSWTIFFSFSSFCIFSAEGKEEEEEERTDSVTESAEIWRNEWECFCVFETGCSLTSMLI